MKKILVTGCSLVALCILTATMVAAQNVLKVTAGAVLKTTGGAIITLQNVNLDNDGTIGEWDQGKTAKSIPVIKT